MDTTVEAPRYREIILYTIPQVQAIVRKVASDIAQRIDTGLDVVVIGILKGSLFFTADLLRALPFDCDYNFIGASSYVGTRTTTMVAVDLKGLSNIKGKKVILVDEICDTGYTLNAARAKLVGQGVKIEDIYTCCLLNKPSRREVSIDLDFVGSTIDDHFVIGYGLDEDGNNRTLPYIYYKERILTNKEAHEQAAGMGLDCSFFRLNNIDPDADYEPTPKEK